MKFDYIIGNPPYQISDGGAQASAKPVYNYFIETAKNLAPENICFIVPSRWMTGGKGLDSFRDIMIHDKRMKILHDYADGKLLFNGVDIKGGVCYFLWNANHNDKCKCYRHDIDGTYETLRFLCEDGDDIFIRDGRLINIKNKVQNLNEKSIMGIVSPRKPYGLSGDTMKDTAKYKLPPFSDTPIKDGYEILGLGSGQKRIWKYIPKDYPLPKKEGIGKYKVFISEAYGCGNIGEVPSTPVLGTPVQICTETFLQIGPFDTEIEAKNFLSYLKTKFFRALVSIKKQTQHTTQKVYKYVPIQDFTNKSDIDWTKSIREIDQQLYKKYGLSEDEIKFIEEKVKEMD